MSTFTPTLLSILSFANDLTLVVEQVKASGACRVRTLGTKVQTFAHNAPNAFKSACFQASMNWRTNRTIDLSPPPERIVRPKPDGWKSHSTTIPGMLRTIHKTVKGGKSTITYDELIQVHDVYRRDIGGKIGKVLWHRGARVGSV